MTIAIIPARMGSSRFWGKPLKMINGVAMVHRVYDAVVGCPWVDAVVVAHDGGSIGEYCLSEGLPNVLTGMCETGTDRVYEACLKLGVKRGIVLNIQGDEPLIRHSHICELLNLFHENVDCHVGTLVYKKYPDGAVDTDSDDVKVQFDSTGRAFNFTRLSAGRGYVSIGIMGFTLGALSEFHRLGKSEIEGVENIELMRLVGERFPVHCKVTDKPTIGVDRPGDIKKVEDFLNEADSGAVCN